jgi:3-methylcrotonyl-CoA carboxylase beta subunit
MSALVADLETKLAEARNGGGEASLNKMRAKGKLTPRERCVYVQRNANRKAEREGRLGKLLDPASPFLELSPLAAHEVYPGERIPGAGIITGIGRVAGRECVVVVNDASVKGGSYYPMTVSRQLFSGRDIVLTQM